MPDACLRYMPCCGSCMRQFFRNNGLSVVLCALFVLFIGGQALTGWQTHNDEQEKHGEASIGLVAYLSSGDFWEATGENWESEFLQMAMFLVLTAVLFQKGSAESRDPDEEHDPHDNDPRLSKDDPNAPWPVRRGGIVCALYARSLSIAFALLFLASFAIHAAGGLSSLNDENMQHGEASVSMVQYLSSPQFWFESFQNWQSEFLALFAMVALSVVLRQKGSPESKPVATPHRESGDEIPPLVPVPVDRATMQPIGPLSTPSHA
jgi:hypothetical protein